MDNNKFNLLIDMFIIGFNDLFIKKIDKNNYYFEFSQNM